MPIDHAVPSAVISHQVGRRRSAVVSFDQTSFDQACREFYDGICVSWRPDLIIAIPTGGLWVAQSMIRSAVNPPPMLPLTCRRPSTAAKRRSLLLRTMIARLPRRTLDQLRIIEHHIVSRRPLAPGSRAFDSRELTDLAAWFAARDRFPSVLVVDDAVDSGATLLAVVRQIHVLSPQARLRTAAITVTTTAPLLRPDHVLLDRRLCRFPWSLDA